MDDKLAIAVRTIQESTDPFEKARAMKDSIYEVPVSLVSLAHNLQVSPTYISNYLRLLRVPTIVRDGYYGELISLSHIFIIARLKTEADMVVLYEQILAESLPTSKTEELVRETLHSVKTEGDRAPQESKESIIRSLQKMSPAVSVKIMQTRIRAKIVISVKGPFAKTTAFLSKFQEIVQREQS